MISMEDVEKKYGVSKPSFNKSYVNSIFSFDVRKLESLDNQTVSMFTIALSQYLIFFQVQYNEALADLRIKKKQFEIAIESAMTKDVIKRFATKKEAKSYCIVSISDLSKLDEKIDLLEFEVNSMKGLDKAITEYIMAFKRELTRRENEVKHI